MTETSLQLDPSRLEWVQKNANKKETGRRLAPLGGGGGGGGGGGMSCIMVTCLTGEAVRGQPYLGAATLVRWGKVLSAAE